MTSNRIVIVRRLLHARPLRRLLFVLAIFWIQSLFAIPLHNAIFPAECPVENCLIWMLSRDPLRSFMLTIAGWAWIISLVLIAYWGIRWAIEEEPPKVTSDRFIILRHMNAVNKLHSLGLIYPVFYGRKEIIDDPRKLAQVKELEAKYPGAHFHSSITFVRMYQAFEGFSLVKPQLVKKGE